MFTALLLLSTLTSSSSAPVEPTDNNNLIPLILFGGELPLECLKMSQNRTVQEIIWSCMATIFACTWVAVHPGLPGPFDWTKFKRKVTMMIYAMLIPELMTVWAMSQWIVARRIVREFNGTGTSTSATVPATKTPWYLTMSNAVKDCSSGLKEMIKAWFRAPVNQNPPPGWTVTHGFFIQMGGFILGCRGDTKIRVLTFDELKVRVWRGEVDIPKITEEEINDKSKGDFLTKLLVVLQTTWFVFQCLARWISHLPVTELEVVILAFAALNIITCTLWWKKPQNVSVAVSIPLKYEPVVPDGYGGWVQTGEFTPAGSTEKEKWITRKIKEEMAKGFFGWCFGIPYRLFLSALRPIKKLTIRGASQVSNGSLRMPMFHADAAPEAGVPFLATTLFFGALHLIPWSSSTFPSKLECWLWRSSALFITAQPILIYLVDIGHRIQNNKRSWLIIYIGSKSSIALIFTIPFYLIARIISLVVAFTALRAPPAGAYENVEWATFLPHV